MPRPDSRLRGEAGSCPVLSSASGWPRKQSKSHPWGRRISLRQEWVTGAGGSTLIPDLIPQKGRTADQSTLDVHPLTPPHLPVLRAEKMDNTFPNQHLAACWIREGKSSKPRPSHPAGLKAKSPHHTPAAPTNTPSSGPPPSRVTIILCFPTRIPHPGSAEAPRCRH